LGLPGTENAKQPFWSSDNRWLGFYADGKVKKILAAGGAVQIVAAISSAPGLTGAEQEIGTGKEQEGRVEPHLPGWTKL